MQTSTRTFLFWYKKFNFNCYKSIPAQYKLSWNMHFLICSKGVNIDLKSV